MSIGDEVNKLEKENKILRELLDDVGLIHKALSDLLNIVVAIQSDLSRIDMLDLSEVHKDFIGEGGGEIEATHQYTVTEHGGDTPSLPYKVDAGQFIPGTDEER